MAIDRDADQYAPHAVTVMRSVLDARQIAPGDLDALIAAVRVERRDERLRGPQVREPRIREPRISGSQWASIVSMVLACWLLLTPTVTPEQRSAEAKEPIHIMDYSVRHVAGGIFIVLIRWLRRDKDEDGT
jgi:hypothetical protein